MTIGSNDTPDEFTLTDDELSTDDPGGLGGMP